jgi:predicted lipoprotein with Yx(FWY)xxD motif
LTRRFAVRVVVLAAVATLGVGAALAVGGPIIKGSKNPKLGTIVVNAQGMTLYHLTSERGTIKCSGSCATAWPPVLAAKGKPTLGPGLAASKVGTIKRPDGKVQVTYNKFPLYRYYLDGKPGQAKGEGVTLGTGAWYAISTAGRIVKPRPSAPPATTSGTTTGSTTTTGYYGY